MKIHSQLSSIATSAGTFLAITAVISTLLPSAVADTVTLSADLDNTLIESLSGALSNGSGDHLFAGNIADGSIRRGLVRFDLSGLPAGATITAATLELNISMTPSGNESISAHKVMTAWGEGASDAPMGEGIGAPSETGDATWIHTFYDASFWASAGGDYAPAPSATANVSLGSASWSSTGLATDVQDWIDGAAPNHGWLLKIDDEEQFATAKRFDSKDHPNSSVRPRLVVEFDACSGTNYCSSTPNSTGSAAVISYVGDCAVAADDFTLQASPTPNSLGIFIYGLGQDSSGAGSPFGNGLRCVGNGVVYRLPVVAATGNALSFGFDFGSPPLPGGLVTAGSTWNFQAWFRDPQSGGAGFDLSDGLQVQFR